MDLKWYLYSWLSSKSGLQSSQTEDAVISYKVEQKSEVRWDGQHNQLTLAVQNGNIYVQFNNSLTIP